MIKTQEVTNSQSFNLPVALTITKAAGGRRVIQLNGETINFYTDEVPYMDVIGDKLRVVITKGKS